MKKLVLINVQELDLNEMKSIEGGAVPPWLWQAAAATFLYNVVADWDENVAAFKRGLKGE